MKNGLEAEQAEIIMKETNLIEAGTIRLLGRQWFASLTYHLIFQRLFDHLTEIQALECDRV